MICYDGLSRLPLHVPDRHRIEIENNAADRTIRQIVLSELLQTS